MAVSIIYLDDHGEQIAERVSDITYIAAHIGYRLCHNNYWIKHPTEGTLLFECGSDKRGFYKYSACTTLYVRMRGFKKSGWYSPNYPERNTIYISPEENGLKQTEYYSLCYQQAEEKIRALAKLASDGVNDFVPIKFSDFTECFSDAFFVDAFTIGKPDISDFADVVNETLARLNEKLSGSEEYKALVYFQLPDDIGADDVTGAMDAIKNLVANSKVGLGFSRGNAVSITVGISYRHHKRGANNTKD